MVIALTQALGQCFVDGGFGDAEVFGGGAYGGTGLDHVHSQLTGPFLQ
jgi:hypothetical protein